MQLTDKQIRHFRDKGFLVVKDFFDKAIVEKTSVWLDELQQNNSNDSLAARYYEKSKLTGEEFLSRVEYILNDSYPEITALLLSEKSKTVLEQLLGESPVLFKDKVNYKLPGSRSDKLHQDQAAGWGSYADFYVTMTVAVDKNSRQNAAMYVMKNGNFERNLMTEEWQPLSNDDLFDLPEEDYLLLEMDPGDVVFFDSFVPHGSPANTGDTKRRNIFLTFNRQSAGDNRSKYYRDKWDTYPPNRPGEARTASSFLV